MLTLFREIRRQPYGSLVRLADKTGFRVEYISHLRWIAGLIEKRDPRLVALVTELGLTPDRELGREM